MNIRDLQYLVAVADLQHFGKAAERCFVSQPTLSMQLKKLEDTLGIQVFERTQKKVMATRAGEGIIEQARRVLQEVEVLKHLASSIKDPLSGQFHLGSIATLGPYLFPHILPQFKEAMPNMHFYLQEGTTHELLKQLKQGLLDAIIIALPVEGTEDFICRELFSEPFLLATPEDHPLAKKKPLQMKDIEEHTLLLLNEGHCLKDHALDVCRRIKIKTEHNYQATSLETLRHTVAMGEGITLLPKLAADVGPTKLAVRKFSDTEPSRKIGMLWRPTCAKKQACSAMAKLIKQLMSQI